MRFGDEQEMWCRMRRCSLAKKKVCCQILVLWVFQGRGQSACLLILIGLLSLSSFKMRESNWSLGSQYPLRSLVSRRPRRFRRWRNVKLVARRENIALDSKPPSLTVIGRAGLGRGCLRLYWSISSCNKLDHNDYPKDTARHLSFYITWPRPTSHLYLRSGARFMTLVVFTLELKQAQKYFKTSKF